MREFAKNDKQAASIFVQSMRQSILNFRVNTREIEAGSKLPIVTIDDPSYSPAKMLVSYSILTLIVVGLIGLGIAVMVRSESQSIAGFLIALPVFLFAAWIASIIVRSLLVLRNLFRNRDLLRRYE